MESSASKCNRALPSAIEPICFGAQLRERYTLKSDIYQLSVLIAGGFPRLAEFRRFFNIAHETRTCGRSRVQTVTYYH